MTRRPSTRRQAGNGSLLGVFNSRSRSPPLLPRILAFVAFVFIVIYLFRRSGESGVKETLNRTEAEGDFTCTSEIWGAGPFLKAAYGDSTQKILHVGPDTCSVVSKLLEEQQTEEAWGIEPYDIEDTDKRCRSLVRKGIVRAFDIKFPLPYRAGSFPLVIVSDAVDYLSPRYLNRTLPELARVSSDGLVIFAGYPGRSRAKAPELTKFGRPAKMRNPSWWSQFFAQARLSENEAAKTKFEESASKNSYKPRCQIFHLKS